MKHVLTITLAACLIFALAGCQPTDDKERSSDPQSESGAVVSVLPAEPESGADEESATPSTASNNADQQIEDPPYDPDAPVGSPENPIAEEPVEDVPPYDPDAPLGSPENPIAEEPQG